MKQPERGYIRKRSIQLWKDGGVCVYLEVGGDRVNLGYGKTDKIACKAAARRLRSLALEAEKGNV